MRGEIRRICLSLFVDIDASDKGDLLPSLRIRYEGVGFDSQPINACLGFCTIKSRTNHIIRCEQAEGK